MLNTLEKRMTITLYNYILQSFKGSLVREGDATTVWRTVEARFAVRRRRERRSRSSVRRRRHQ